MEIGTRCVPLMKQAVRHVAIFFAIPAPWVIVISAKLGGVGHACDASLIVSVYLPQHEFIVINGCNGRGGLRGSADIILMARDSVCGFTIVNFILVVNISADKIVFLVLGVGITSFVQFVRQI